MSKVDDMLNKLFGDGIKDHYTLDDAKELITEDTTAYELIELKAQCAVIASVLITKGLVSKEEYTEAVKNVTEKLIEQTALVSQKYLNDGIEKVKEEWGKINNDPV